MLHVSEHKIHPVPCSYTTEAGLHLLQRFQKLDSGLLGIAVLRLPDNRIGICELSGSKVPVSQRTLVLVDITQGRGRLYDIQVIYFKIDNPD